LDKKAMFLVMKTKFPVALIRNQLSSSIS